MTAALDHCKHPTAETLGAEQEAAGPSPALSVG